MRVLIVSPHFPPTNAADMQRVRLLLPHLSAAGVEAEVLAVGPKQVAAPVDPWLCEGLPAEVPVHRVEALSLAWTKVPGFGTLSLRAMRAMGRRGDEILRSRTFDLIYFSTTQFGLHALGPRWKRQFAVPFVMDYQDPWVNDYYRDHPEVTPPGGPLKFGVAYRMARRAEPRVLRDCAGITSVSAAYPAQLAARYGGTVSPGSGSGAPERLEIPRFDRSLPSLVLPFPGDDGDLERVRRGGVRQGVFDPADGHRHWVYVGRGGQDMARSVRALFGAVQAMEGEQRDRLRLHFIGTSYAAAGCGRKTIEPIAAEFGLGDMVEECPDRIPYSETLKCLLDADALIVPGSDDPAYTASKIYPYLLAEKPLLAIFHEDSPVVDLFDRVGGGTCVRFADGDSGGKIAESVSAVLSAYPDGIPGVSLDRNSLAPFLAPTQARQMGEFFDQCRTQ